MNETNTPHYSLGEIDKNRNAVLAPIVGTEVPIGGIKVTEHDSTAEIQHDKPRVSPSLGEVAVSSILVKGSGLNYEVHAEAPQHVPVLAEDDAQEIHVNVTPPAYAPTPTPIQVQGNDRQLQKQYR